MSCIYFFERNFLLRSLEALCPPDIFFDIDSPNKELIPWDDDIIPFCPAIAAPIPIGI